MYRLIANLPDFIVINKANNSSLHCEQGRGLLALLSADLGCQVLPVHRLDKATSGLLLCAKTSAAASELSQQFQQRTIEKYYLAISDKKPKRKQGLIKGDMVKARRGSWKLAQTYQNPAVTQFFSYSVRQGCRLFLLKPHTGKTHQLRVALKSIGAPIIGDQRYYPQLFDQSLLPMALHAYYLYFTYQDQSYHYCCLPPKQGAFDTSVQTYIQAYLSAPNQVEWPNL